MSDYNENRDGLTGLWSRKYGLEQLEEAVARCSQVALIFIDIDRFKWFNEKYNHDVGDEKIIEIAREIEAHSGENSLVSRVGGQEFLVMLPQFSLEAAREVAEAIWAHQKPVVLESGGREITALTLSLGLAHFPTQVSSAEHLLHAADLALMKAKGEGIPGGRWPDGTVYIPRNRVMAIGDFLDDFPEQSARFLKPEWIITGQN